MKPIERRNLFHQEVRAEGEGEARRIMGYGAVFYRQGEPTTQYQLWSGAVERIMPGAFDRALKEDDVRGLFNHNPSLVLARNKSGTMALSIDATGLRYEITPGNTTVAGDVLEHLSRGDVTGSSISFRATEVEWETEKVEGVEIEVRKILEVELFDVGPVTFPAYEATDAGLRSTDAIQEVRDEWAQRRSNEAATAMRARLNQLRLTA